MSQDFRLILGPYLWYTFGMGCYSARG